MKIEKNHQKDEVFESIAEFIAKEGFEVVSSDQTRPWGGFFVINESQAPSSIEGFFSHLSLEDFAGFEKLSPKIE